MSHSLHRRGDVESLKNDYVIVVVFAKGYNNDAGAKDRMKELIKIVSKHKIVNFGNAQNGNSFRISLDQFLNSDALHMANFVFQDKESLLACLRELKEKDIGFSVVVSGLYKEVVQCCKAAGLKPHTVQHSLETHGAVQKLPPPEIMDIITMCGHAIVSPALVEALLEKVRKKDLSLEEASIELSRVCDCGLFNPPRAAKLMEKLL